jgi:hypothetical protein
MNDLQKEINELKEFILDLKAERAAARQKEKSEAWTKYVSLTIVAIAVIGAVAAQWSGKYSGKTQMSQVQASDKWAYYEAKTIKQHLDEVTLPQLLHSSLTNDPKVAAEIKKLTFDLSRYEGEKTNIQAQAETLEKARDEASARGGRMGMAVILLSVAISTASICTVTKKKPLWFAAMLMAAFAVYKMISAWTL